MTMSGTKASELSDAMKAAFTYNELRRFVSWKLERNLEEISLGNNLEDVIFDLIQNARDMHWEEELVQSVSVEKACVPEVAKFCREYQISSSPPEDRDPYEACFLPAQLPFIDRNDLREYLRELHSSNGACVLLVNGHPSSGKTFTWNVIRFLGKREGFRMVSVDITTYAGKSPDALARSIVNQMGIDGGGIPTQQSQATQWAEELCDWLVGKIRTDTERWWLVLDGFSQSMLRSETHELIKYLAVKAHDLDNLRLALLAYDDLLPPQIDELVMREQIERLDRNHLVDHFRRFYRRRNEQPDEGVIDDIVEKILRANDVNVDHPLWMKKLAILVKEATIRLSQSERDNA